MLHSGNTVPKKDVSYLRENIISSEQRIWRDLNAIEENIDKMDLNKTNTSMPSLDETVDMIISKNKRK